MTDLFDLGVHWVHVDGLRIGLSTACFRLGTIRLGVGARRRFTMLRVHCCFRTHPQHARRIRIELFLAPCTAKVVLLALVLTAHRALRADGHPANWVNRCNASHVHRRIPS